VVYYEAKSGKGAAFRSRSPYFPANWSRENSKDSLLLASTVKEGTAGDPSAAPQKKTKSSKTSKGGGKSSGAPSTPAESAAEPLAEPLGEVSSAEAGNFWMNLGTAFSGVGDAHYPMYLLSVTGGKRYYPQAYPAEVLPIGEEFSHTPEELWALMHTESTFHRFVASRVGAIGLMQIMPKTGRAIAARLGFDDFRPGQLFDASTNLYFAGWYYRKLKEVFQGQLPLAMAAYNGGPYMIGRIIRAKTWTKPELDEIIEEIPARESRLYAKKVMYKTSKYQKLYKGETSLAIDLSLNTEVGLQVDF
jgi:soluble lytic murein transglycosylase